MSIKAITVAAIMTVGFVALPLTGCESSYNKRTEFQSRRASMTAEAKSTMNEFKTADPTMDRFFRESAGYAVFPVIAKGGAIIGGAHGEGTVYQNGELIGYSEVSQGSIGAQLGGQTFSEIIFFENNAALSSFKAGNMEFSANASAVAANAGAGAAADYQGGVAVFTKPRAGLMFEASIGGQKFDYYPR